MRPLVIGVDARELLGDRTGVGRYLGELMRRWVDRADAADRYLVLYAPEPLALRLPAAAAEIRVVPGGRGTWWEQTSLSAAVRRDAPDLFFAPAYTAPFSIAVPFVVTIHDVSFSRHPAWFRWREGLRRRVLTRQTAKRAAVVLTDSAFSRAEIQELYGVAADRIRVIPAGVTPRHADTSRTREPIVLYTGSIFTRRRLPDLIAAFALTFRMVPSARLIIVGDNRTWPPQDLAAVAAEHRVSDRVELRSYVSDAELATLYASASVFAFLSEYEGFGLTPLEALAAEVPIVVLDTPVAREVYGDAAEYVGRGDIAATAQALTRLLTSDDARAAQLRRAPGVVSRYSWDRTAEQTLRELERAARR